jgi:hypothetical protein
VGGEMKLGRFEIKRVENMVWDYVVPFSLVLLGLIYSIYYNWNCFYRDTGAREITRSGLNSIIITGLITLLILILATLFLRRLQRIIIFPWLIVVVSIIGKPFGFFSYISTSEFFVGFFEGMNFFLGNLVLIIKYGKKPPFKNEFYSFKRSILAWGILGLSLFVAANTNGCYIPVAPGGFTSISKYDVFNRVYTYLESKIFGAGIIIFLSFVLLGFVVEKLKQWRAK